MRCLWSLHGNILYARRTHNTSCSFLYVTFCAKHHFVLQLIYPPGFKYTQRNKVEDTLSSGNTLIWNFRHLRRKTKVKSAELSSSVHLGPGTVYVLQKILAGMAEGRKNTIFHWHYRWHTIFLRAIFIRRHARIVWGCLKYMGYCWEFGWLLLHQFASFLHAM